MFSILAGDSDYLYRFHCAAALLQLMGEATLNPVDANADHPERESTVSALSLRLTAKIGESPTIRRSCCLEGPT